MTKYTAHERQALRDDIRDRLKMATTLGGVFGLKHAADFYRLECLLDEADEEARELRELKKKLLT